MLRQGYGVREQVARVDWFLDRKAQLQEAKMGSFDLVFAGFGVCSQIFGVLQGLGGVLVRLHG